MAHAAPALSRRSFRRRYATAMMAAVLVVAEAWHQFSTVRSTFDGFRRAAAWAVSGEQFARLQLAAHEQTIATLKEENQRLRTEIDSQHSKTARANSRADECQASIKGLKRFVAAQIDRACSANQQYRVLPPTPRG